MILNVYEFKMESDREACLKLVGPGQYIRPSWTIALTCIEKIFLIFNSSANFIFYCFAGREFRRLFCHSFCFKDNVVSTPMNRASILTRDTKMEALPLEPQPDKVINILKK